MYDAVTNRIFSLGCTGDSTKAHDKCKRIDWHLIKPEHENDKNRSKRLREAFFSYRRTPTAQRCPERLRTCKSPWPTPTSTGARAHLGGAPGRRTSDREHEFPDRLVVF